ncbi:prepilin-type N-terminal cleavage/methylation domain-containing protein [Chitiniphilus purpureus]|uniref:Prepilin-type N-terminal cleavage/methylation domain-containing protein n=1 Tax=Chitiniphilus purpureus TaxID=2981137 RepID=A0ABY6DLM3_9NEIS|nr:prepilin-type N-terminal cleavage/methylation domain-containing protein [Chitiniphilus sp. CD1]UXY15255.1 prepilin-type N-terminal cleavage/methylation domain-containing protein [Chitiniphilus sp. CD1]
MARRIRPRPRQRGTSLVELAVVLLVIGILLGGALGPLQAQWQAMHERETRVYLDAARAALLGFLLQHGRLPCPAPAGATGPEAGHEAISGMHCRHPDGALPWQALSLPRHDGWGRPLRYAVTPGFADHDSATPANLPGCTVAGPGARASFSWCTTGALTVHEAGSGAVLAPNVAAVLLSHGANGVVEDAAGEAENNDGDTLFAAGPHGSDGFDDLVSWLSPYALHEALLRAGRLP